MGTIQNGVTTPSTGLAGSGSSPKSITNSARFRRGSGVSGTYFNRLPTSAGNRQKWTWSGWVKRGAYLGSFQRFFMSSNVDDFIRFDTNNNIQCMFDSGATGMNLEEVIYV